MEDVKPMVPSNNLQFDSGIAIEARFIDFCKTGLSLDEDTFTQAKQLFKDSNHLLLTNMSAIGTGAPEEVERFWFAFVLYSVKRLTQKSEASPTQGTNENGVTLCQILRVAKLNIVDFFKELPQFIVKAGPILSNLYGADWEKRLEAKELQTNFVHLSLLSKYYKRAYLDFFLTSDANAGKQSSDANTSGYLTDYHRFGWLLFLALRVHVFSRFKDLVTCTNGLDSIMEDLQNLSTATGEKGDDLIRVLRKLTAVQRKIADLQVELQGRKKKCQIGLMWSWPMSLCGLLELGWLQPLLRLKKYRYILN